MPLPTSRAKLSVASVTEEGSVFSCLCPCVSVCVSISMSFRLSECRSVCVYVFLSASLSVSILFSDLFCFSGSMFAKYLPVCYACLPDCRHSGTPTGRQAYRQAGRQTGRRTNKQTDRLFPVLYSCQTVYVLF